MSKSFVRPPVDEPLITEDGYLTSAWQDWFLDNWQTTDELASEAGILLPRLTTDQRDSNDFINQTSVSNGDLDGLMIYNTTIGQGQILAGGVWTNL